MKRRTLLKAVTATALAIPAARAARDEQIPTQPIPKPTRVDKDDVSDAVYDTVLDTVIETTIENGDESILWITIESYWEVTPKQVLCNGSNELLTVVTPLSPNGSRVRFSGRIVGRTAHLNLERSTVVTRFRVMSHRGPALV